MAMYPRIATPYTVSWCHCRPSTRPSVDRAPSATIRCRAADLARRRPAAPTTPGPPNHVATSTALTPSIILAPSSAATMRMRSSSSVRGTALLGRRERRAGPVDLDVGAEPGHPQAAVRGCARRATGRGPSSCSSATARGVRPSPHALSRGNVAESITSTSRPPRAAQAAAADPAGPAPTTTTSAALVAGSCLPVCWTMRTPASVVAGVDFGDAEFAQRRPRRRGAHRGR